MRHCQFTFNLDPSRQRSVNNVIIAFLALTVVFTARCVSAADIYVPIDGRGGERIRIAVPEFVSRSGTTGRDVGRQVAEIIGRDLDFSGYFDVLNRFQYPPDFTMMDPSPHRIDFARWTQVHTRDLIHGICEVRGDRVEHECRLFDVQEGRQIVGKAYQGDMKMVRRMAHRFADEVVLYHTGRLGIAHTVLAFTSTSKGNKELFVCDYDGENARQVTNDGSITLSPAWSPDCSKIAYTSYRDGNPDLYVINADGSSPRLLSGVHGLNSSPCWSPSGDAVALTLSKDGDAEIYLTDMHGKNLKRLTYDRAIDTSPSFSPDGSRIAFVSDRSGGAQIWVVDVDGRNLHRVSYQGGRSFEPTWSPLGDKIAYTVDVPGEGFQLYVMNADGSNAAQLTSGPGWNQEPAWSPNGTHIVFSSNRDGRWNIYTMRVDGMNVRRVTNLRGENQAPAWSR